MRLFLFGLFADCCGPRFKGSGNESNISYIDKIEHLNLEMDETLKEYDIFAVHKIHKFEQDIDLLLKTLKLNKLDQSGSCDSDFMESLCRSS